MAAAGDLRGLTAAEIALRVSSLERRLPIDVPDEEWVLILTGGTGFVGTALLHETLRVRKEIKCAFIQLVIRPKKGVGVAERVTELFTKAPFDYDKVDTTVESNKGKGAWTARLSSSSSSSQKDEVVVVGIWEGNLDEPMLGVSDRTTGLPEGARRVVVHCAASVRFDLSLRSAVETNVSGTLRARDLARDLGGSLVYASTAFVHHKKTKQPMTKVPLETPDLGDAEALFRDVIDGNGSECRRAMRRLRFPNSYTFSKALAEALLRQSPSRDDVSVVRPAIIGPAWACMNSWCGTTSPAIQVTALLYAQLTHFFTSSTKAGQLAVVPVDAVSRRLLQACCRRQRAANDDSTVVIFRQTHTARELLGELMDIATKESIIAPKQRERYRRVHARAHCAFDRAPAACRVPIFRVMHFVHNSAKPRLARLMGLVDARTGKRWLTAASVPALMRPFVDHTVGFEGELEPPDVFDVHVYAIEVARHAGRLASTFKQRQHGAGSSDNRTGEAPKGTRDDAKAPGEAGLEEERHSSP